MDITAQLDLSMLTIGKIFEPPSPTYPSGRVLVVQRVTQPNANYQLPSGQYVSIYPRFIPRNPRTQRQQANRWRLSLAQTYLKNNPIPTEGRILEIMRERNLPPWHAKISYLLKESGLF